MISNKIVKSFGVCASLGLALLIATAGCGGSGITTTGTTGSSPAVTAQTAPVAAAQGATAYLGINADLQAAPFAVKTVRSGTSGKMPGVPGLVSLAFNAVNSKSLDGSNYQLLAGTNFFYKFSTQTTTTGTILFSTDGTTNNAGNLNYVVQTGTAGSYPATLQLTFTIGPPALSIAGVVTATGTDSAGDGNIQGTVSSPTLAASVALNLTEANGTLSGTMSVTKAGHTVDFSNIGSGPTTPFTATFSSGTAVTGTISVNADGSGLAAATDSTGTWNLTWTAGGTTTLTSPNNVVKTGSLL